MMNIHVDQNNPHVLISSEINALIPSSSSHCRLQNIIDLMCEIENSVLQLIHRHQDVHLRCQTGSSPVIALLVWDADHGS